MSEHKLEWLIIAGIVAFCLYLILFVPSPVLPFLYVAPGQHIMIQ